LPSHTISLRIEQVDFSTAMSSSTSADQHVPLKSIALLGATSRIGPCILIALLKLPSSPKVIILQRSSSKSDPVAQLTTSADELPPDFRQRLHVAHIADDFPKEELIATFKQHDVDAVVSAVSGTQTELQKRVADACVSDGVKVRRYIPADYGSCDSQSEHAQGLVPIFKNKSVLRAYLMELVKQQASSGADPAFSWTSIVCGHFFDMDPLFMHIDLTGRKLGVFDDGNAKFSCSTLAQVGRGVATVLDQVADPALDGKNVNKVIYIQSLSTTQNALLSSLEKVTGQKWSAEKFDSDSFVKSKTSDRDGDNEEKKHEAISDLVWWLGTVEADWTVKREFGNKWLGLPDEELDQVVEALVNKFGHSSDGKH
jgi:hypothetical protein